jgi:MSHA biogenesis protein MshQ
VTAANIGLGNYTGNLGAGETTPTVAGGAFSNGRKTLLMSAPGAANNGSVDIVVNLGTTTTIDSCLTWGTTPTPTGANLSHLRGQWCGATYTKDPTARATFGVFKGAEEVIFQRENF